MSFSVQAEAVQWVISLLGTCVKWQWLDNEDSWWTGKLNFRFWLSLYIILYPPKPVTIPYTRVSGRRVCTGGPLGQGTATGALHMFRRGERWWWWPQGFLCSMDAARTLPWWGTIAWITFCNEVMMVIWHNSVTLAAESQFPAFSALMKMVLFSSKTVYLGYFNMN